MASRLFATLRVGRHLLAGLSLLACAACATPPPPAAGDPKAPLIAPDTRLTLPPLAALWRRVEATQMITARYGGRTMSFEGHLSITPERFLLVGVDGLGQRVMTITWTNAGVTVESPPWIPDAVRPGSMLADIVLLYWPVPAVRRALGVAADDSDAVTEGDHDRTIRLKGKDVLRAHYSWDQGAPWNGTLTYTNLAWGYEITVQSVEETP